MYKPGLLWKRVKSLPNDEILNLTNIIAFANDTRYGFQRMCVFSFEDGNHCVKRKIIPVRTCGTFKIKCANFLDCKCKCTTRI